MSLTTLIRHGRLLRAAVPRTSRCLYATEQGGDAGSKAPSEPPKPAAAPKKAADPAPVQELFDNTQYQCKNYYEHNEFSFYDYEDAMLASRVGQPSSVSHYNQLPKDVLAELEKAAK